MAKTMGCHNLAGAVPRSHPRDHRGAVAVEFGLVLPLLVMLMLGVVTFGLAYDAKLSLTNGVREGSRFGAALPSEAGWATDVVDRTTEVLFSPGDPTGLVICAKLVSGEVGNPTIAASSCSIVDGEPPLPAGVDAADCVVKVWAQRPATLNILVAQWDILLGAQSVSYYERMPCGPTT